MTESSSQETARKIVFLTGTRADFGKLKPLMQVVRSDPQFHSHLFVTGMHLLAKYGYTCEEVERAGLGNVHKFINQTVHDGMDQILSKTIAGLADYVRELQPDLIVVHGDRVEALAGAAVGALNNVLIGHIEGGEVSGTVDELIRHAVTKLSHVHFVANEQARARLIQLGERDESVHVIGSPDIDVMASPDLPSLAEVRRRYEIGFDHYGVMLFHPVTSELGDLQRQIRIVVDELLRSGRNYVVIYPNNDHGSDVILAEYERLRNASQVRMFPSMRFEYFLSLLKHADFMIGNSSAGVREAPHFGVPALNLGSRQNNRVKCASILDVAIEPAAIASAIGRTGYVPRDVHAMFGDGNSAQQFHQILKSHAFWRTRTQKYFVDRATSASH